ncbi:MAG TPA: polysaccharide biosynthesis tyrosine autokinase [Bryobacteraceae bacterium]|nr:polysaccharide biosynthesis tyrosine autokinase [Bryobacteraceae bacterium]
MNGRNPVRYLRGPSYPGNPPAIDVFPEAELPARADSVTAPLWKLIRRYKFVIAASALVCGVTAFFLAASHPPSFVASAAIEIQDFNDNVLNTSDVVSVTRRAATDESYLATEMEMLTTTSLLQRVSDKLSLESQIRGEQKQSRFDGIRQFLGIPQPKLTRRQRAIGMLRGGMEINAPKGSSRIVRISYSSGDPQFAARVANTIANEFIEQNLEWRLQDTVKTSRWLGQQIEDLRARLQQSEDSLRRFGDSAGLMFTSEKDNVAEAKLKQLQDELSKAQADRIERQSHHEIVARADARAAAELLDSGPLRDYQIKLADARQKLAELEAIYTANHPKVLQARAEVTTIEASIESERRNVLRRSESEFLASRRREQLLTSAFNAQTQLVTNQEAQAARYMLLKNEVDANKQMYDAMLQKVKSLNIASALQARNIIVVDAAEPPATPSEPRPLLNACAGVITGLLMAGVFVFARERANESIHSPGLTQSMLQLPELGAIPSVRRQDGQTRRLTSVVPGQIEGSGLELATLRHGDSAIADSFRGVVASLLFNSVSSGQGRAFAVTSALPSEGKTTTLCNLAVVLSRINRRVLVIDADFRRPRLSTVFGVAGEHGLTDVLRGDKPVSEYSTAELVVTTAIPRLSVLPIGKDRSAQDMDLLHSPRLREVIERVRSEFDFVLADTPPVIPVPDARLIGPLVDGVLIVCRASVTSAESVRTATRRFQEDGSHVIGTILNDFDPARAGRGYDSFTYYKRTRV